MNQDSKNTSNTQQILPPPLAAEKRQYYPATLQQEGVWFQSLMMENKAGWNSFHGWRCSGPLDRDSFERAIDEVVKRHAALRTSFFTMDQRLYQRIHSSVHQNDYYQWHDLGDTTSAEAVAYQMGALDADRPFDLETGPLARFLLFRIGPDDHIVIINKHHIVFDVSSRQVLWRDLTSFYREFAAGRHPEPVPLQLQYCDFALWQRDILVPSKRYREHKQYWLKLLESPLPVFSPPGMDVRGGQSLSTGTSIVRLDQQLVNRLRTMSLRQRISFASSFLSAYVLLLNYYGREREVMVGTVYRGRNADKINLDRAIGLFVNRLALRLTVGESSDSISAFMRSVHRQLAGAYRRQDVVFEDLLRSLQPSGDTDRAQVFQVTFNMLKVPSIKEPDGEVLTFKREWDNADRDTPVASRYPLSLYIRDDLDGVEVLLLYSTAFLRDGDARRLLHYYEALLETMSQNMDLRLREVELLDDAGKREILDVFNNTKREFNAPKTITALFERIVGRHPHRSALAIGNRYLTFAQLDLYAAGVASMLANRGMVAGSLVPIISTRSLAMIVGVMGILKLGGAYVPLDPASPQERLQRILADIDAPLVMTDDIVDECIVELEVANSSPNKVKPDSLAYIIYTSGSTGIPKGVGVEHAAIVNTLLWRQNYYEFSIEDIVLQIPSFTFDASVIDIFNPLIAGFFMLLASEEDIKHLGRLVEMMERHSVTHFLMVPNFYRAFLEELDRPLPEVRVVTLGGERVFPELLALHGEKLPDAILVNEYGPTENSVCSTAMTLDPIDGTINIGTPISNCQCTILDHNDRLCPVGIPGHLHLGGSGLARGYINNPDLTAERFIPSPFSIGERIYRSGDLARWLPEGSIDFLGRIDNQVKIRGFRIELGEIEAQVARVEGVDEAAVRVENNSLEQPAIVAFVTGSAKDLRDRLVDRLPDYMIPDHFVHLAHMPRTISGKIDRNKLPRVESIEMEEAFEAPSDPIQQVLAAAWESVLGCSPIGVRHNFFALGGDSIKAMQVIARLQAKGLQLELSHIFSYPTIQRLSPFVDTKVRTVSQQEVNGPVPLIPIQHWFVLKNLNHPHHFNMARLFECAPGIPANHFKLVTDEVVRQHDMLRAVLSKDNLSLDIRPSKDIGSLFRVLESPEQGQTLQQSLDLYDGPLAAFALIRAKEQDYFFIVAHHLIMDGVSLRILEEDFQLGLAQLQAGAQLQLPPKSHSFVHWSKILSQIAGSDQLYQQSGYWKEVCQTIYECCLPGTCPQDPPGTQDDYLVREVTLDGTYTRRLLENVHHAYNTSINDILLSGLALALHDVWGCDRSAVNLESHGRHPLDSEIDLTRTVGWFTCQYPVALEVHAGDPGLHIRRVKEMLRLAPDHGLGFGMLRYLDRGQESSVLPAEPQISFNYMGELGQTNGSRLLKTSRLPMGPTRSSQSQQLFPLTFNGRIADGRLRFTVKGDSRQFQKRDIFALSQSFGHHLEQLIDHCGNQTQTIPTPSDFSAKNLTEDELIAIMAIYHNREIEEILDLSPMQEGILFHHEMEPQSSAYAVQTVYRLEGEVEPGVFEESMQQLWLRHEAFRLGFVTRHGPQPRQVVFKNQKPGLEFLDLTEVPNPMEELENIKTRELLRRFHLETEPAVRFLLVKTCLHEFHWIVTNHHIIMDGWSNPIWLSDFLAVYRCLKQDRRPEIHETAPPYSDYIRWLGGQDSVEASRFWGEYLGGFESSARLEPHDWQPDSRGFARRRHTFELPVSIASALTRAANRMEVTLSNVMQAVWAILLHRYTRVSDVVFGTVMSGRHVPIKGVERIVGLFIGTVPVRIKIEDLDTLDRLAVTIRDTMAQCQRYSYIPLAEAARAAGITGSLFEHLFVFENYPVQAKGTDEEFLSQAGFKIANRSASEQTNYNLNLLVIPRDRLILRFQYNGLSYTGSFVARLAEQLLTLLRSIAMDPGISLQDLEIVPPEEKQLIMQTFNATEREFPSQITIHDWFLRQSRTTPDALAIQASSQRGQESVFDVSLTYGQFLRSVAAQAACLIGSGVEPGSIVAVMGERSVEVMTAIFAILMAGGAYMPIDPSYPHERILYILKDSNARALLCNFKVANTEFLDKQWQGTVFDIDLVPQLQAKELPFPTVQSDSRSPAYLIYTSGSTGKPKGTLLEHRSLCNRLHWMQSQYPISHGDTLLHKTPFTFDVSVWEIFWWAITGSSVALLVPNGERDPGLIASALSLNRIAIIHFVPSMMKAFLDFVENGQLTFQNLRWVISSGEVLPPLLHHRFRHLIGGSGAKLANLYGPTEACIDVTYFNCPQEQDLEILPIGKPIDNTVMVVVAPGGNLQPIGVAGELCIAGEGLARGYLNKPELTHRAFVEGDIEGISRFYRSGDLARFLPDGNLHYLGRLDHQVKIRGFRIELEEVESLLQCDPAIDDAAVAAWGASEDCVLAAYIVPSQDRTGDDGLDIDDVRSRLRLSLPEYMVPSEMMTLSKLPLNSNGKLDRKALPKPGAASNKRPPLRLPVDEVEKELAAIWRRVLKLPEVGLDDHFFALGGHSLRAMNLVGEIRKQFEVEVAVKAVFDHPVLSALSFLVKEKITEREELLRLLSEVEAMDGP